MVGAGWTSSSSQYAGTESPGEAWAEEAAKAGRQGTHRIVEAGTVQAPARIAALLKVPEGSPVVVRRRAVDLDGSTVELTDSFFLTEVAAGTALARPAKIRGGPARLLRESGIEMPQVVEEIESRPATKAEAEALRLPADVWVLVMHRTCATADGRPVQVDVMVVSALDQRLRYEMQTGGTTL
ncbi:UTRA domain-containing protein [Kitasatospora purpeofusca]|uniref:UTRA domain-containing protein n=1 Tax=Kitasatospora purpeofusca TaxID=67352 RepID=UPI0035DCEBF4